MGRRANRRSHKRESIALIAAILTVLTAMLNLINSIIKWLDR